VYFFAASVRSFSIVVQGGPLAHPDEPVAGFPRDTLQPDRVVDAQLEQTRLEADLDLGASVTVPGGVGQRLLEDAVRRLIECGRKRPS
jgi:hypothetical protein